MKPKECRRAFQYGFTPSFRRHKIVIFVVFKAARCAGVVTRCLAFILATNAQKAIIIVVKGSVVHEVEAFWAFDVIIVMLMFRFSSHSCHYALNFCWNKVRECIYLFVLPICRREIQHQLSGHFLKYSTNFAEISRKNIPAFVVIVILAFGSCVPFLLEGMMFSLWAEHRQVVESPSFDPTWPILANCDILKSLVPKLCAWTLYLSCQAILTSRLLERRSPRPRSPRWLRPAIEYEW